MTNIILDIFTSAIITILLLNMINLIVANLFDINLMEILVNWIKHKTEKDEKDR